MAERRGTGLSFGQLITLTFGFLLASVVIFFFGYVVGVQVTEQRGAGDRDVARVPVGAPPPAPTLAPTVARVAAVPPASATPLRQAATPTLAPLATATRAVAASPTPRGRGWTVQAYATNDTMRAVMLARTLRSKGYDASTGTRKIGGVTWYVVRVGRFTDRAAAKALEGKLRAEEGLEAASVTAQ